MEAVIFVNGPQIKDTFQSIVVGMAEERPNAIDRLTLAAREDEELFI